MSAAGLFAEITIFQRKTAVFHLGSCSGSCCVLKEKRIFLLKDNNYPNNYPKEIPVDRNPTVSLHLDCQVAAQLLLLRWLLIVAGTGVINIL